MRYPFAALAFAFSVAAFAADPEPATLHVSLAADFRNLPGALPPSSFPFPTSMSFTADVQGTATLAAPPPNVMAFTGRAFSAESSRVSYANEVDRRFGSPFRNTGPISHSIGAIETFFLQGRDFGGGLSSELFMVFRVNSFEGEASYMFHMNANPAPPRPGDTTSFAGFSSDVLLCVASLGPCGLSQLIGSGSLSWQLLSPVPEPSTAALSLAALILSGFFVASRTRDPPFAARH